MTKKEAIAIFERAGYTYKGFNDIGWGEKFYCFENPNTVEFTANHYSTFTLGRMRSRARTLDAKMWLDAHRARLREGIQEELFTDTEIETHYAIVN